jgi:hypothetical protein
MERVTLKASEDMVGLQIHLAKSTTSAILMRGRNWNVKNKIYDPS